MLDLLSEQVVTLCEAAKRLPRLRKNRPVHVSTLWRWALRGLRGVRLETTMIGGVRVTSTEALQRFFARLASNNGAEQGTPGERRFSELQRIETELDKAGI